MALKGEYGDAQQIAYRILYAIGNGANADRLMDTKTSHISGVNYHNIGDAGLQLLEDMAKTARFVIPTTINPCGVQVSPPIHLNFKQDLYEKQERILAAFAKMGSRGSYTCIPYEYDNVANMGDHVSWAESSAVLYGNSVLGIMTNRESGLSALDFSQYPVPIPHLFLCSYHAFKASGAWTLILISSTNLYFRFERYALVPRSKSSDITFLNPPIRSNDSRLIANAAPSRAIVFFKKFENM